MTTGRYRLRTWLRGRLPDTLAGVVPKGSHDCGNHEWYRADEGTWRCYHCQPGTTGSSPWTREEHLQYALGGIDATLRTLALADASRREPQVAELRRLIREVRALLPEEMDRLEQLEKAPDSDLPALVQGLQGG
jgi:hypothetical protein